MKPKVVKNLYLDYRQILSQTEFGKEWEWKYNNRKYPITTTDSDTLQRDLKCMCLILADKLQDPYKMPKICQRYVNGESKKNQNLN